MGEFMAGCLPRYLGIRGWLMETGSWNTKLLVGLSTGILLIGIGFLWFGLKLSSAPLPAPSIAVQSTHEVIQSATNSAVFGIEGERALVTRVVDGDTINVEIAGKAATVRFVGMDTPETVDPKRPVGCFGKEASNETKSLLSGKEVVLQKDTSETDKYGRLLRYVYLPLPDGKILFVDDYLVREGFARVLTYPPDVKYNEQFRQAETEARIAKKGLWGSC